MDPAVKFCGMMGAYAVVCIELLQRSQSLPPLEIVGRSLHNCGTYVIQAKGYDVFVERTSGNS